MDLMTYNEILTYMCDTFDELISPRAISRNNTNIIYLIFKAIAKGYEVINSVCVTLNNKFNPASCSDDDLQSIATLVGTERLKGSATGLYITVINNKDVPQTLRSGFYSYDFENGVTFTFEMLSDTTFPAYSQKEYFAFSDIEGSFPVTQQASIDMYAHTQAIGGMALEIPDGFSFACINNERLLGTTEETNLEFRNRILTDTTRQDVLTELQTALRNLPYIFDCRVLFNNSDSDISYEGYTIPPYHLAIFYSGEARSEIAGVIVKYGIYPTTNAPNAVALQYITDTFQAGYYPVYVIPFKNYDFGVQITYRTLDAYVDFAYVESTIQSSLALTINTQKHVDYINEATIYNQIMNMEVEGITILNVDLLVNGSVKDYIAIPASDLPHLTQTSFIRLNATDSDSGNAVKTKFETYIDNGYLYLEDGHLTSNSSTKNNLVGTLELPETVVTIGDWTFASCPRLTGIVFDRALTNIGVKCFNNSPALVEAIFKDTHNWYTENSVALNVTDPVTNATNLKDSWLDVALEKR